MKKKIQKYLSGEREGFSLIELIIVIAIMAILIGVIALVVLPYLESARENRDRQTLSEVSNAFKSAMANEKVAQAVGTQSVYKEPKDIDVSAKTGTAGETLETYMRKYMDNAVSGTGNGSAQDKLSSENCKGKVFKIKVTKNGNNYEMKTCIIDAAKTADADVVSPASGGDKYEQ